MPPTPATSAGARGELARRRLAAMGVVGPTSSRGRDGGSAAVAEVVGHHLAMQAQDLPGVLWSVGVRTDGTQSQVLAAWQAREVTRTWPMRGTLHLMASRDLAWTCELLGSRSLRASRARCAQLGLDDDDVALARRVVVRALEGGSRDGLSRSTLYAVLSAGGVAPTGQRGIILLGRFCIEGLLCQGVPEGGEPTFVLLDQWAPSPWRPGREEAMATVAERYVLSHGPVTERDLAGWTGQTLGFTREAVALVGDRLTTEVHDGTPYLVHVDAPAAAPSDAVLLLPGFDEYLLGVKDRSALLTKAQEALVVPGGNGVFLSTLVVGGVVAGTWGRRLTASRVTVTVTPWTTLPRATVGRVEQAAADYGRFLDREVELRWAAPDRDPGSERRRAR